MSSWFLHTGRLLFKPSRSKLCLSRTVTVTRYVGKTSENNHIRPNVTWSLQFRLYSQSLCLSPSLATNESRCRSLVHKSSRQYGSKRKKRKIQQDESSSDSESDDSDDDELEDNPELEDDPDAPANFRLMTLHIKSLRVDSIVSGGLDISRNRIYEMVFSNKLRYNGNKLVKKSKQVSVGDYVDVITEKLEDVLKVQRVKIIKISSEKTRTDKHIVHVKVWKQPFEILNVNREKL